MSFKQRLTLQNFADESNATFHSGWLCLYANRLKMTAYCNDIPSQGMQSTLLQISSFHCPSLLIPSLFLSLLKIQISLTFCAGCCLFFLILTLLLWLMNQLLNYKEDIDLTVFFSYWICLTVWLFPGWYACVCTCHSLSVGINLWESILCFVGTIRTLELNCYPNITTHWDIFSSPKKKVQQTSDLSNDKILIVIFFIIK